MYNAKCMEKIKRNTQRIAKMCRVLLVTQLKHIEVKGIT